MHLETLLDELDFSLPAVNTTAQPFVSFAEQKIERYINQVNASFADLFTNSPPQILDFREYANVVSEFGRGLIQVIRTANSMDNHLAYPQFKELMDKMGFLTSGYPASLFFLDPAQQYYRCKAFTEPALRTHDWFFHTGFHLRAHVGATRFTPAGFPALYLTNALAVGYREVDATTTDGFQAVKYKIKPRYRRHLLNLDYTRPLVALRTIDTAEYDLQLQFKGLLYPLFLCCFTRKSGGVAPQEYIIPQFVLKWAMQGMFYTGIMYPSTKAAGPHYNGRFYNLIIPPVDIRDSGYCSKLKEYFQMSSVVGYTHHAAAISDYYDANFVPPPAVNAEINSIDWNGLLEIYDSSDLGKMEFFVASRPVADIPL